MNREEMIKRLEAGDSPIDVSIQKWVDIRDGVGTDNGGYNCACCYTYGDCNKGCPIQSYDNETKRYGEDGMCGEIASYTYKNKDRVLEFIKYMKEVRKWVKK